MSAYIVDDTHIDALLTAGLSRSHLRGPLRWWLDDEPRSMQNKRELTYESADAVGAMLVAQNRRSVNERYREEELETIYTFHKLPGYDPVVHAVPMLLAVRGYGYQACETDDWPHTDAYMFCHALTDYLVSQVPGYDEAHTWHIGSPDVFRTITAATRR